MGGGILIGMEVSCGEEVMLSLYILVSAKNAYLN